MGIAQKFESGPATVPLANLFSPGVRRTAPDEEGIPVLPELAGLLPDGLRRGEAVSVLCPGDDPDYLCLALLAGALAGGLWCAAVGVPGLGVAALAGLAGPGDAGRAALDRLLLVPDPGPDWAQVVTVLADGVDLLLARPPERVRPQVAARVDARLRQRRTAFAAAGRGGSGERSVLHGDDAHAHRAALAVLGPWDSARLVLRTTETVWVGLHRPGPGQDAYAGVGNLSGGRATVLAEGRATAGRPRTTRLWLPGPDGAARALLEPAAAQVADISGIAQDRSRASAA